MSYSGTRLLGVPQGMTSRAVATPLLPPYIASLAQLVRATDFKIGASAWKHAEWRRLYAGTPLEPPLLHKYMKGVKI